MMRTLERVFDWVLFFIFIAPLFLWAWDVATRFDSASLSPEFYKILVRSIAYTSLQGALSAVISVSIGIFIGLGLSLGPVKGMSILARFCEHFGLFAFFAPGLFVATCLMNLSASWGGGLDLAQGFFAIVIAHVLMNALFVATSVNQRLLSWLAAGGQELVSAASVLGLPKGQLIRVAIGPVLRAEFWLWLPLVFLWSFSAFATVLILAGSDKFASPEVLLFYALHNDSSSARLAVLLVFQLALGLGLSRFVYTRRTNPLSSGADQRHSSNPLPRESFALFAVATSLLSLLLAAPLLGALVTSLFNLKVGFSDELVVASSNSAMLALFAALILLVLTLGLFYFGDRVRRYLIGALGVSSTVLAGLWFDSRFEGLLSGRPMLQLFAISLALALSLLPLSAYWLEERLRTFPKELADTARVLGLDDFALKRRIILPTLGPLMARLLCLAAMAGMGELVFSSFFAADLPLLPLLARRLAQHYDYSAGAWVTLAMFAGLTLSLYVTKLKPRRFVLFTERFRRQP